MERAKEGEMTDAKRSEVLQGTLDLMILKTLHALGPQHGFGIAQRIEQVSRDVLQLNEGTVYTSLLRQQPQGEVLLDHRARREAACGGDRELGADFGRGGACAATGRGEIAMGKERISRVRAFRMRVLGLFRTRKRDSDFDEEVHAHLQLLTDRFVTQGMSEADAAAAARRQFGNTTLLQEDRWELRTLVPVEDLWRDVRYALRSLGRSRAFAAVAIATLGLGIGASTAIFSVIDNVLLEPFPYKDAG